MLDPSFLGVSALPQSFAWEGPPSFDTGAPFGSPATTGRPGEGWSPLRGSPHRTCARGPGRCPTSPRPARGSQRAKGGAGVERWGSLPGEALGERGGSRGTSEPSMIDCRHRVKAPGGERAAKKGPVGCPTRKNGSHVTAPTRKNGSHVTAPPRKCGSHVPAPPPKNRSHVRVGRQQVGCPLAAGRVKTSPPGGGRCVPTRNNGEEVGGAGRPTRPRLSREHTWRHSTATDTPQPPGPV